MATLPKYVQKQVMLLLLCAIPVLAQPAIDDDDIKRNNSVFPKELRLLAMLPLNNGSTEVYWEHMEGRLCNIAIKKALEDINAFPDLLVGYSLTYDTVDLESCDYTTLQLQIIFNRIQSKYGFPYVLLGGGCEELTEKILQLFPLLNNGDSVTQIAYLPTSSKWFQSVYRLTAPERVGSAIVQLLATYNWSRVAILCEQGDEELLMTTAYIELELAVSEVDVITSNCIRISSYSGIRGALKELKNLDARIFVVIATSSTAMAILCDAYKLDLYGKHFVWIFTERFETNTWALGCTEEEIQKVAEGVFFIDTVNYNAFDEMGIANITYSDLIADIIFRANLPDSDVYINKSEPFDYAVGKCYDHVWVAALALDCYLNNTDSISIRKKMDDCIRKLDFVGATGRIKFGYFGTPNVVLQRIQDATTTAVAYRRQGYSRKSRYEWIEGALIWKDGIIPIDSTRTTRKEKSVPMSLYLTMSVLAGVGIIVTITCFAFNVVWGKHRIVKMSSPNINSILLAGCLLLYVTIVIKTTVTTTKAMCAVQLFCFGIGFATTFGSMLSKTWRVHRIFNNKKWSGTCDKHLLVIIGIVVTMETALMLVWESYSPHQVIEQKLKTENVTTDNGDKAVIVYFYRVCVSEHSKYFIWTLRIMNGALIAIGAILAWETRQVHIDALNDSKTIGICLYNVLILSAVNLFLSLILEEKPVELDGVTSVCLFVGTLVSEMMIFLPKMLAVYRNPIATPQTAVKNLECLPPSNIATQQHIELVAIHSPEHETTT